MAVGPTLREDCHEALWLILIMLFLTPWWWYETLMLFFSAHEKTSPSSLRVSCSKLFAIENANIFNVDTIDSFFT